jgi:hypothetical protein
MLTDWGLSARWPFQTIVHHGWHPCRRVNQQGTPKPTMPTVGSVSPPSFVFPRRCESVNTGKAGYAPACRNASVHGVCRKPAIKCGECPSQAFIQVSNAAARFLPRSRRRRRWRLPFVADRSVAAAPVRASCARNQNVLTSRNLCERGDGRTGFPPAFQSRDGPSQPGTMVLAAW